MDRGCPFLRHNPEVMSRSRLGHFKVKSIEKSHFGDYLQFQMGPSDIRLTNGTSGNAKQDMVSPEYPAYRQPWRKR